MQPLPFRPAIATSCRSSAPAPGTVRRSRSPRRKPCGGGAVELLPGLSLVIDQLGPILDEAQMALADLKHAQTHDRLAVFKAAAHRLAGLANHVARTAKEFRPREHQLQQK
jgi:hypothetical protein